jgi:hypothetical protein
MQDQKIDNQKKIKSRKESLIEPRRKKRRIHIVLPCHETASLAKKAILFDSSRCIGKMCAKSLIEFAAILTAPDRMVTPTNSSLAWFCIQSFIR